MGGSVWGGRGVGGESRVGRGEGGRMEEGCEGGSGGEK